MLWNFLFMNIKPVSKRLSMLFLFGRSISPSLSKYFTDRAAQDSHQVAFASMGEFQDTEPFAELLNCDVEGQLCVVFQSITQAGGFNASSNYLQMLACADGLKRFGAKSVWAMNPFGGFMRQDKIKDGSGESLLSHLSGRLMKQAGFDGLSTVEAHSNNAIQNYEQGLGRGNVLNIIPNKLFHTALKRRGISVGSVANPDLGADERAQELAQLFGVEQFSIDKNRNKEGTSIINHHGKAGSQTLLVDDMASSLGTVRNAIGLIYDEGSRENTLLISHPIMTGQAWDNLAKLIRKKMLDHVVFLPTFSRDEEFIRFKQQYGPDIAEKIIFLEDEFNELIYNHVTQEVVNHPVMRREVA
jgi:ribose-phosphate pyrophosphokinase